MEVQNGNFPKPNHHPQLRVQHVPLQKHRNTNVGNQKKWIKAEEKLLHFGFGKCQVTKMENIGLYLLQFQLVLLMENTPTSPLFNTKVVELNIKDFSKDLKDIDSDLENIDIIIKKSKIKTKKILKKVIWQFQKLIVLW